MAPSPSQTEEAQKDYMLPDNKIILLFRALTILMVGLAVTGAIVNFTPVLHSDMWHGCLDFILHIEDGDNQAWWAQFNEHRIVLTRILFWLDFRFFRGASLFLIIVNFLLTGVTAFVFRHILRDVAGTKASTSYEIVLGLVMTSWLFMWAQHENLIWGFQSQFFMAQLLPLCALYGLQKSLAPPFATTRFIAACTLGILSAGTMANGVLALPLMTVYAFFTRQKQARILTLVTLSVLVLFLYLHGYSSPNETTPVADVLQSPNRFIRYIFYYLGNPFYYIMGEYVPAKYVAFTFGIAFVSFFSWHLFTAVRMRQDNPLSLMLIAYIFYVIALAVITSAGRMKVGGVDQALISRYTTPVLMAWCALLLLYFHALLSKIRSNGVKPYLIIGGFALCLLPQQLQALSAISPVFEREVAQLALTLHVTDKPQIGRYLGLATNSDISQKASSRHLSAFGLSPYREIQEQIGKVISLETQRVCPGQLEGADVIDGDENFIRISGWIYDPQTGSVPKVVRCVNTEGKIVGFALTGRVREDVTSVYGSKAQYSGYVGYVFSGQAGTSLSLQGPTASCQLLVKVPRPGSRPR